MPDKPYLSIPADQYTVGDYIPVSGNTSWAHLRGLDGTSLCWEAYTNLADPGADYFVSGVTPSWDGSTPLTCTVEGGEWVRGKFRPSRGAVDTFTLEPR